MRLELVQDWMTREVITVGPDILLSDAHNLMTTHAIRRLPVVENGRLAGIVTYGDIRSARPSTANNLNIWEMQYVMAQLVVAEIMTPNPMTVWEDTTVGEAAQTLLKHKIGSLPVVSREASLVGIITESDIFRLVARDWRRAEDESTEPYARYSR